MKRLILALLLCIILTSCANNTANGNYDLTDIPTVSADAFHEKTPTVIDDTEEQTTTETESESESQEPTLFSAEEYFENTLFVGDSVVSGLKKYVLLQRKTEPTLPGARFLETQEGVSISDLTESGGNGVSYTYKGVAAPLEEILTKLNSDKEIKRIFIMLGTNDLALFVSPSIDNIIADYRVLLDTVNKTLPDADVIVMLNTPRGESNYNPSYVKNKAFNVTLVNGYVEALRDMCEQDGIKYLDAHTPFLSAKGGMTPDDCSDNYIHLTNAGASKLVSLINEFAESDGVK